MTTLEKVTIQTNALLEELEQYSINHTYLSNLKGALATLDLDKMEFCLLNIKQHYIEKDWCESEDYRKILDILLFIEEIKEQNEARSREVKPLMQFWVALNTWLEDESQDPASLYCKKYQTGYSDWGQWFTIANVDNDKLYKMVYGRPFTELTENNITISKIKEFVEAYFIEVIEPEQGRFNFTVKVNNLLSRFNLPYKLQKGKMIRIGYRTSFKLNQIENYDQFERKIAYAAEMILYGEFIDKHSALNYIADAFCYLQSLYKSESKSFIELVNADNNSNVYRVIKDEVEFINRVINYDFDIRHNEQKALPKNKNGVKREPLKDSMFVEYLYNRINALLSLLRLKHNQNKKNNELPF